MFGVIGVSPASGDVSTFFADRHGGNMDDHVNARRDDSPAGLPERRPTRDPVHARVDGDGEISGTGVEIGGPV